MMVEKKGHIRHPFPPLAQYDDLTAQEVEGLRRTSEALSRELETLTAELNSLNEQLELGGGKGRLKDLYAEQALNEEKISELRRELPRIREECAAFRFDTDPSRLEEDFGRISAEFEELRRKQESISRELPVMERDIAVLDQSIAESEAQLRAMASATDELEVQSKLLAAKNAGLERLEGALLGDKAGAEESTYTGEVAALGNGLTRKDGQSLVSVRDLAEHLEQEFGCLGEEIKELLLLLISKFSLMQEVEEKEQRAASLKAESEALQGTAVGKTAALEEIRTLTREDKKRISALENELHRCRNTIAAYEEEAAMGDEMGRKKEAAAAEFIALFIQKAELEEKVLTAGRKMRALKDVTGNTA
jgi:chromosome segregation ATPase